MEERKETKKEIKTIDEMSEELKKLEEQASNEEASKKTMRQMSIRGGVENLIMCMILVEIIVGALLWRVRISGSTKEFIGVVVAMVVATWGGYRLRDEETAEESRLRPRREEREAKMRILMKEIGKAKEGEENERR